MGDQTSKWIHNKTKDSNQTTGTFNLTNVSAFDMTDWKSDKTVSSDDMELENSEEDGQLEPEKQKSEVKLKNFNGKLAKLAVDDDLASMTMPPVPQPPLGLSMTMTNLTSTTATEAQSLLEPESFCQKFSHLNYVNDSRVNDKNKSMTFDHSQNNFKIPMAKHNINFNNTTCLQEADVSQ